MGTERGGVAVGQADFAQTLARLKRDGSNVLLVGAETTDIHTALCHRLLGETDDGARYRLFVTDGCEPLAKTNDETDERTVRTIDYSALDPAATADAELRGRTPLGTLGIEIADAIDGFQGDADGLEPSQLRVCVDSLVALLEEHTVEKVFRLLHMTTSRVDTLQGMGHYHLPLDRDHEAVHLFEPLFDAVVETRVRDGVAEQRWELRDREAPTDWLSV
ncbi:hypothetical protein Htur_1714 [Haloterrigena turkmenica DSM 5511]|uniref:KaiC-like domain-containing protein n=1 Tax=Haloterrigena turkmenica (strain ATCC 51198 / DSM 5511 / JCM 9101 / NCIMB 13204 / VKM B-1734 / 4k) TaxID=543526 RepID=D2RRN9_HALTV|nr:hypothetical protein [Haloterrigena turkmenica]ADB60599.1 hypothetical protein Htur_1714 [Haloterrigena turkmenica DSM 5511]